MSNYERKLRIQNYNNTLKVYHLLCENVNMRHKVKLVKMTESCYVVTYKPSLLNVEFNAYLDYILITHDNFEVKVRSIEDCISYVNNNTFFYAR